MAAEARRAAILVAFVAIGVYANSLLSGFAYDDVPIIVENEQIHDLRTLPRAIFSSYWPGTGGETASLWRPVTTAAFGLQYAIGGGSPFVFHLVNVLLHAAASVGVLLLLGNLLTPWAALLGALVFAVHPVHVEAVANVVGFAEVFSAAAVLGALLVHVRAGGTSGWRPAALMGVLYLLAFGAKESAVTLPGLVFLVDAARERLTFRTLHDYLRRRWRAYAVLAAVAAVMLAARVAVLGTVAHPVGPMGADVLYEIPRIWTLGEVWVHYVRLWAFPLDLSADYSPDVLPISFGWNATNVVGVLLALALLVLAWAAWRTRELGPGEDSPRAFGFAVVWFLIAISPIANVLFLSGVLLAERTLYLPSIGLAAGTGWLLATLVASRRRVGWSTVALVMLLAGIRTWTRNETWRDNQSVLITMLRDQPHSGRSQWLLGDNLWAAGDVSGALATYRHAVNLLGTHYRLHAEVARKLMDIGAHRSAERLLEPIWERSPDRPLAPRLLAVVRAEQGDPVGTEFYARRAIELYDWDPIRHHLLAWALAAQGKWHEAEKVRAVAESQARGLMWQQWLYRAYDARRRGDFGEVEVAIDSARASVRHELSRATVDSIVAGDFPDVAARRLPR